MVFQNIGAVSTRSLGANTDHVVQLAQKFVLWNSAFVQAIIEDCPLT
jgi:hypothetical protein